MSGLEVLLMVSTQDDSQFLQYFPINFEKPYLINELLLISKFFKKCGKGSLLSKDKLYYYSTYTPNLDTNTSQNVKRIFLLFYCNSSYQKKYLEEFTNNIFNLLDLEIIQENKLKQKTSKKINDLFDIYKNIKNKEEIYKEYVKNIMKIEANENILSNNTSLDSDNPSFRKRVDSRIYRSRENSLMTIKGGNKSTIIEDIEMIKMTGSVNDLTIMFKEDKFSFYNMKLKKYNKIRIINFIFFSVLALVMYSLIPLSFKDKC